MSTLTRYSLNLMVSALLTLGFVTGWGGAALAAAGAWFETDHGRVRLISAQNAIGDSTVLQLGLHFEMKPGWKIYWRSPGDAGFPPQPMWKQSENLASASLSWPVPERFSVLGLETLGYKKEVVLPVQARLEKAGQEARIRASVPYLTCEEICVPYEAKLALDLPAGAPTDSLLAAKIAAFAARVPAKGARADLAVLLAEADGPPGKQMLRIVSRSAKGFTNPDLLIEGPDGFAFGRPKPAETAEKSRITWLAAVHPPYRKDAAKKPDLAGAMVRLTVIDGDQAIEQEIAVRKGMAATPSAEGKAAVPAAIGWQAFLGILSLALIGGMILNLMPCVLPVLSLKLLSVVGHGGGEKAEVRRGFLATTAGIIVSFWVLAGAAVLLKATGQAAGWGIQFQHPVFLSAMAVIVSLFAANLFGLFEIHLPGSVADKAASAGGNHSLRGHFLTGAFATLLATPCSAPFLGTAVGFALSRGAAEILAIFTALGIGLAVPYLLVALWPSLATRMPRPGPWMVILRKILGVALAGTAVWLLAVLGTQAGDTAMVAGAGFIILAMIALYAGRRLKAGIAIASVIALFAVAVPPLVAVEGTGVTADGKVNWQAFAPEKIADHVAAGKTVFVDVTADWCVTCKVNKALVLDTDSISTMLNGKNVIAMQADWTRPDPVISAFLEKYSRYGIPFNVVYGPANPRGVVLPELLTASAVTSAIGQVTAIAASESK